MNGFCRRGMTLALALGALLASGARAKAAAGEVAWIGLELEPGPRGVVVKRVLEASPGEQARIRPGDVLLSVGGAKVTSAEQVIAAVRSHPVGERLHVTLAGPAGERSVDVQLEARPDPGDYQRKTLLHRAAPDFHPRVQSGARLDKLSSLKGRVVLIDFFATWCGPCMDALPTVEALHEKLASKGLEVVGVSTEEPAVVAAAAAEHGLKYRLVADEGEAISARYHVYALPTVVVIDRRGVVQEIAVADVDAAERKVEELLR